MNVAVGKYIYSMYSSKDKSKESILNMAYFWHTWNVRNEGTVEMVSILINLNENRLIFKVSIDGKYNETKSYLIESDIYRMVISMYNKLDCIEFANY